MRSLATFARLLIALTFAVGIASPIASYQAVAEATESDDSFELPEEEIAPPATGSLQIWLNASDSGALLGGACFDLTDAAGNSVATCDYDFDGVVIVSDLPPGVVSVSQSTPANLTHDFDAYGTAEIVAGELVELYLLSDPYPPAPEPEPVVDEGPVVDEEPAVEEAPASEPEAPVDEPASDATGEESETTAAVEKIEPAPETAAPQSNTAALSAPQADPAFTLADDAAPELTLTISCPTGLDEAVVGGVVAFAVKIENTGTVPIEELSWWSNRIGNFDVLLPESLAVGEEITRIYQVELDLYLDAWLGSIRLSMEVWGYTSEQSGSRYVEGFDVVECPWNVVPSMSIVKQCPAPGFGIGDSITYQITLQNTGPTPIDDLEFFDDRAGAFVDNPIYLAPGATSTFSFQSEVTPTDALKGHVDNTVTVIGFSIGRQIIVSHEIECSFPQSAGIEIQKQCPSSAVTGAARVGQVIPFTVTITNGGTPLSNVVVADSRAGSWNAPFPSSLEPWESVTRIFLTTLTYADAAAALEDITLHNGVTVTADGPDGEVSAGANTGCYYVPYARIELTKSCPVIDDPNVGDFTAAFPVTISNTGDVELTDIVVEDTGREDGTWDGAFPETLQPGQSATVDFLSVVYYYEAEGFSNSALVTAQVDNEIYAQGISASDYVECSLYPDWPWTFQVACPANLTGVRIGDEIAFPVSLSSHPQTWIVDLVLTPSRIGTFNPTPPEDLFFGENPYSGTFTTVVTSTDALLGNISLSITVAGELDYGEGTEPISTFVELNCPLAPVVEIEATKTCPTLGATPRVGDPIVFGITVENTGAVPVSGLQYYEDRFGTFGEGAGIVLYPGDSWSFEFTGEIELIDMLRGKIVNTLTVTTFEGGYDTVTVECLLTPYASASIAKSCPSGYQESRVGDSVVYKIVLTNNGDVPLTGIVVTEERAGTLNLPFPTTLAIGQTVTRFFTSSITADDAINGNVGNVATVTATGAGVSVETDSYVECSYSPYAELTVTAGCPDATGKRVGDAVSFSLRVENTGDVTLRDFDVITYHDGVWSGDIPATLAPGEFFTVTFTRDIETSDVYYGSLRLYFEVQGWYDVVENAYIVNGYISDYCDYVPFSQITVTKSCPTSIAVNAGVGTTITYEVTVKNDGDTVLYDLIVTDTRAGSWQVAWPESEQSWIEPGESITRTFESTITAADAIAGNVNNTVTAAAQFYRFGPADHSDYIWHVEDTETVECPFTLREAISIVKSCTTTIPVGARVDSEVTFSITIENTGSHTLTDVAVTDVRNGFFNFAWPTTLGIGESATRTFTTLITLEDAADANVFNAASVSATGLIRDVADSTTAWCEFTPFVDMEVIVSCPHPNDIIARRVGTPVAWGVFIKNTGDVALRNVSITANRDGSLSSPFGDISPGEAINNSFVALILVSDAETGSLNFSVVATAEYGDGVEPLSIEASDAVQCPFTPTNGIDIVKQCPAPGSLQDARIGDDVSYQVTITNTGDTWIGNLVVTDSRTGDFDPPLSTLPEQFARGAVFTTTFTTKITAEDAANRNVANTITVSGLALGQESLPLSGSDSATCGLDPTIGIGLQVTCPQVPAGHRVGQTVAFGVTISNRGDLPLSDLVFASTRDDGSLVPPLPAEPLGVGQSYTGTFVTTLTYRDADVRSIDSVFTVSADSNLISTSETAVCSFSPFEHFEVTKRCKPIAVGSNIGDPIEYEITFGNTGDTFIVGIDLTESRSGFFTGQVPSFIGPTDPSVTVTFTTALTEADITAGFVNNTASVSANGGAVTTGDTASCELTPGSLTITKTGDGEALANACFELHNEDAEVTYGPSCTDEGGVVRFTSVRIGHYVLTETTTPDGFVTMEPRDISIGHADAIELTIENPVRLVGVTVFNLDCAVDPGEIDGAALAANGDFTPAGCVRVGNVSFDLSEVVEEDVSLASIGDGTAGAYAFALAATNSFDNPYVTGTNGGFAEQVYFGSNILVTQDATTVTPGYLARENPLEFHNVQGGEVLVFVNLPQAGTVKLLKLVCKSDKPAPVKFETSQSGFGDIGKACWRGHDVSFTISGGSLASPVTVKTDREGLIALGLNAGDYTVTETGTQASAAFSITAGETTWITVTNYKTKPEKEPEKPTEKPVEKPDVEKLPDTGAGVAGIESVTLWLVLLASLGLAGFVGGATILRTKRQLRPVRINHRR